MQNNQNYKEIKEKRFFKIKKKTFLEKRQENNLQTKKWKTE